MLLLIIPIELSKKREENIMSEHNDYCEDTRKDGSEYGKPPDIREKTASKYKFNASLEKKIEFLWFQSRRHGWSYNDFVIHLLDILIVLQLRDKINGSRPKPKV
jgi:hypothetical protein